jgi:hypothetical protein
MGIEISRNIGGKVLKLLEIAARDGARCPMNAELPVGARQMLPHLAREGKIKIEVSGHNWRVVTILEGPEKGKKTAPDPTGSLPYITIDGAGTTRTWPSPRRKAA